jgi:hypothetical protein
MIFDKLLSIPEWGKLMAIKSTSKRVFSIGLLIGLFFTFDSFPSIAQNTPITLTLLYTNNIWAEIDPCPV